MIIRPRVHCKMFISNFKQIKQSWLFVRAIAKPGFVSHSPKLLISASQYEYPQRIRRNTEGTLLMNNSYPETLLETINFDYTNCKQTTNLLRFTDWLSTKYRRPPSNSVYIHIPVPIHKEKKKRTIYSQTMATTTTKPRETSYTV